MKDQLKIQAGTSKENKKVINLTEMNVSGCLLKESKGTFQKRISGFGR